MAFIHNDYTLKIFNEFRTGDGHVFIQARAGTGKTTSLIELLKDFYENTSDYPEYMQNALVCFVAFSNEVKKDIDKRVPQGERAKYDQTIHAVVTRIMRNTTLDRSTDRDYIEAVSLVEAYIERNKNRKGELLALLQELLKSLQSKNADQAMTWSQLVMEDLSDIDVKTFHGLGYGILRAVYEKAGTTLHLDEDKYHKIIKDFIKPRVSSDGYLDVMNALKTLVNHARLSVFDPKDEKLMRTLAWQHDIDLDKKRPDLMKSVLKWLPEVLEIGEDEARDKGIIDYTDMIYLPIKWNYKMPDPYKIMFVDEAQDLSKVTRNLIINQALDPKGRVFFIGDNAQCVIDGTIIDGRKAEDIQEGDLVSAGFGSETGKIVKARIDKVYHRQVVNQPVITIKTKSGKSITTTPNHTHFAGYASRKTFSPNPVSFIVSMCSGSLDGDTILHSCDIRAVSPEVVEILKKCDIELRENKRGNDWWLYLTTTDLSEIYELLAKIREHVGVNLIEIADLGWNSQLSFRQADQITPGMKIFIKQSTQIKLDEVTEVNTFLYTGGLHDFDVDIYHNYIANDIVTHNSIMGFAGADVYSVNDTITLTHAKELPLDICYRCPTSHIKMAQKLVPAIQAHQNAKVGTVVCASPDILTQIVKPGDMVLCRNTAPLFQKAIECLRARIPARIRGRDLCENIVSIIKKIEKVAGHNFDYDRLDVLIDDWAVEEIRYLTKREVSDSVIQTVNDKRETLQICYKDIDAKDTDGLIEKIRELIPSSKGDGRNISAVEFSTIHRAKGLEADRIFILEPQKVPAIWDKQQAWQLEQEKNLLYVAITRSKEYMCILGKENVWDPYIGKIIPTHTYVFEDGEWKLKLNQKEVKDTLNEFIVGSDAASKAASTAIAKEVNQEPIY